MEEQKKVTKEEVANETVVIDKKVLDDLMRLRKDIEHLKKGERPLEDYDPEDKKLVKVSFIDEKPVIGWKKPLKTKIVGGEKVDYIGLVVKDGDKEKVVELKYLDYIRGEIGTKETCEVISVEQKVHKEFQGYTTKKYVQGYRTVNTGVRVPVKIETLVEFYTVKLPNNSQITINTEYLN